MTKKIKYNPDASALDLGIECSESLSEQQACPVTVLGMTFPNDEERRAYFRAELRAKLPELRQIEGFPIGSDDDIINLSDPPYYTACPNPWLNDFIAEWEKEKRQLEADGKRHPNVVVNEPYAADISEGKNNPIYNAHGYHTKVPHTAIIKYILHYTQPGDIILDAFCGSGMTGVASNMCESYGKRFCILSDLAPIASHISAFYTLPFNYKKFLNELDLVIDEINKEVGELFEIELRGKKGSVTSTIWSDCFMCPNCGNQFALYDLIVDEDKQLISDNIGCPNCGITGGKKDFEKVWETKWDPITKSSITQWKKIPIREYYTIDGRRSSIRLNEQMQSEICANYGNSSLPQPFSLPEGEKTNAILNSNNIRFLHQFYTPRTFAYLNAFSNKAKGNLFLQSLLTSVAMSTSNQNKFRFSGTGIMTGTFFLPSISWEFTPCETIRRKATAFGKVQYPGRGNSVVNVASATNLSQIPNSSIDYIFIDPPFGSNIMYSELSSIWEGWLNVVTNNHTEAIINRVQRKTLFDYQHIMSDAFKEFFRVLKPGKWMTVEFSNTSNTVWNSIQTALQNVGFVVANVSALDKQQGSFNAVTTTTAVKQDLIISCFKPTEQLLNKFDNEASETNVWDFIDELLSRLPVHIEHSNLTTAVVERSPKILYDRLISFYVQHGFPVPLNAQEFQAGLRERYAERDGMYFTPSQAATYDEMRKHTQGFQASLFFVDSEQGGIAWLNNELSTPQTYQELQPKWMQAINGVRKGDILPELMQILEENFIKETDGKWRKPNLQDDVDLAALRLKALMREFKIYVEVAQKPRGKIKEARVEALRAGFKQCYQDKDFATIVAVGDRIPQNLLTEDEQLLQFYEIASSRV